MKKFSYRAWYYTMPGENLLTAPKEQVEIYLMFLDLME
jgi:hypothetical protein